MTAPLSSTLHVRVPASTSNLGPGFDLLGLAVSLYLDVRLTRIDGNQHELHRSGPAAADVLPAAAATDLVVRAFDSLADRQAGKTQRAFYRFDVHTDIPVARGFGSSGASVAAGLLLANALADAPSTPEDLLPMGIAMEGHPDNVTAALLGGCTLCHPAPNASEPSQQQPLWIHNSVHASVAIALAWNDDQLDTNTARSALPETVRHIDAVENARRLPLLLEGLRSGDRALIAAGGEDRLHVPYRLALIPGAQEALVAANEAGAWLATISGAGSGLVALGSHDEIETIAESMRLALAHATDSGYARVVQAVTGSPMVRP